MDMNDAILLKTCENRDRYYLIMKYINKEIVGKEAFILLHALGDFYNAHPDIETVNFNDFAVWFTNSHSPDIKSKDLELYKALFAKVGEANPAIVKDLIEAYVKKDTLSQLQDAILRNKPLEDFQTIINSVVRVEKDTAEVSMDILEDTEITDRSKGLKWRLNCVNSGAGHLIVGDFVLVAGRFNSGKSSFVVSELSHMAEQLPADKDVLLFVNEGRAVDYKERIYQSVFNVPIEEIKANRQKYKELYLERMGRVDKIKLFKINKFTHRQVEALIKKHNPGLIVIDMIDHIGGFKVNSNEPSDQKVRVLYHWVLDVAGQYAPVIGTTQVSNLQGQDPRWPAPEKLTGSTTAKQEAPNLIIIIGQEEDLNSTTRYISSTKNKFRPENEYFKFTCKFDKHNVRFI
jgi:replicative DNA helicase